MTSMKNPILILAALAVAAVPLDAGTIPPAIEKLHQDIWKRFVQPNGVMLDYNTPQGDVELPTAEEAENGKPNALSWWTPVENGPFFTGLYLDAAVRRWKLTGNPADREKAARLAAGLMLCASVADVPGFIARNVLPDGRSHYALGSDDQTAPWFQGLWSYVSSGAATPEEKKKIEQKMVEVAEVLRANQWRMPVDPIGGIKSNQLRGSFSELQYRGAARMLFITRIMAEITGDQSWRDEYETILTEETKDGKTRLQIIEEGLPELFKEHPHFANDQLWLFVNPQAMVRELTDLEKRPEIREKLLASLRINAETVAASIKDEPPANLASVPYKTDWRAMNEMWHVQTTGDEASELALEELRFWNNQGRNVEISGLREPFAAAAIFFLSPDAGTIDASAKKRFRELTRSVPWADLYSAYGLFAELAAYTGNLD